MMMVIPAKPYTSYTCGLTTQVETTQVTVDLALIQDAESATLMMPGFQRYVSVHPFK